MLDSKKQDLIIYLSLLFTPISYAIILVLVIMQKAINFSDFNSVLAIYAVGALITYLLSIPYMITVMKENIERNKAIIRLAIYHLPTLITITYSLLAVITSAYDIN